MQVSMESITKSLPELGSADLLSDGGPLSDVDSETPIFGTSESARPHVAKNDAKPQKNKSLKSKQAEPKKHTDAPVIWMHGEAVPDFVFDYYDPAQRWMEREMWKLEQEAEDNDRAKIERKEKNQYRKQVAKMLDNRDRHSRIGVIKDYMAHRKCHGGKCVDKAVDQRMASLGELTDAELELMIE